MWSNWAAFLYFRTPINLKLSVMTKRCYVLFLSLLVCTSLTAQCSVTKQQESHSTSYICKMEKAYLNEDLENGICRYDLRIVLNKDTSSAVPSTYLLQCRYTISGAYLQTECAPRSIVFQTSDGVYKGPIWATHEEDQPTNVTGGRCSVFTYYIDADLLKYLQKGALQKGSFWDKITGKGTVSTAIYKDLLSEQLECLKVIGNEH